MIEPNEKKSSKKQEPRLLILGGNSGAVACRIHDTLASKTLPRYTGHHLTWATATLLRLSNLEAVRGNRGESMIGPNDLYGTLEMPHKYLYTIHINNGFPTFKTHPVADKENPSSIEMKKFSPSGLKQVEDGLLTRVKATWISGQNKRHIRLKSNEYQAMDVSMFGDSLFPNPGLLEIEGVDNIELQPFDARQYDLSPFKARLVANDCPFQITTKRLSISDEFRAVSYLYEENYAARQIREGGGLFLEHHPFAQTMTPLDESAKGFVTIGRWNEETGELELLAIRIPFGYTLIIEEDCIHGDTTFSGMYLMCMTSNHLTMSEADTVFLKNKTTKQNVSMSIGEQHSSELVGTSGSTGITPSELVNDGTQDSNETNETAPLPLVIYKNDSEEQKKQFRDAIRNRSVIFNPSTSPFWDRPASGKKSVIKSTMQVAKDTKENFYNLFSNSRP